MGQLITFSELQFARVWKQCWAAEYHNYQRAGMDAQITATKCLLGAKNRKDMAACIFDITGKHSSPQFSDNGFGSRWPGIKGPLVAVAPVMCILR